VRSTSRDCFARAGASREDTEMASADTVRGHAFEHLSSGPPAKRILCGFVDDPFDWEHGRLPSRLGEEIGDQGSNGCRSFDGHEV